MYKLFIAAVTLFVLIIANPPAPPTSEEVEAELVASGLSKPAANGILAVGDKFKVKLEAAQGNEEATKKVLEEIKADTDAFIKTQSSADQTAYAAFVAKKKSEFEGHHSSPVPH